MGMCVCVTGYEFAISVITSISPAYDSDRKQAIFIIMSEAMDWTDVLVFDSHSET